MRSRFTMPSPWRGLDAAEKFLAYNLWSLQAVSLILAAIFALGTDSVWGRAGIIVSAATTMIALHFQPAMRIRPIPPRPVVTGLGFTLNIALALFGWFIHQPNLTALSLTCLLTAFTPFMPRREWWTLSVTVLGVAVLGAMASILLAVLVLFFATYTPVVMWTINLMMEADRARVLESRLRVSEERLRFAQDLHDTLGQNLAGMSIKTQLATKFAERGDARLTAELHDLQTLIDATVADMHGVVDNYRSPDLTQELTGAIALLDQAGIAATLTGSTSSVPSEAHEIAAWFVRETTTNVLRHSRATHVSLVLEPGRVEMSNDAPSPAGISPGAGLRGLQDRASAIGGTIRVDHSPTSFTATLELP